MVRRLAESAGVAVHSPVSHTLYDPSLLLARAPGGRAPLTMQVQGKYAVLQQMHSNVCPSNVSSTRMPQGFLKLIASVGDPPAPAPDPPATLAAPAAGAHGADEAATQIPTLEELGYTERPSSPFKGGESTALARMADYLAGAQGRRMWGCRRAAACVAITAVQ